ncbi:MAG: hypothetical protein ACPGFC_03685 [Paracoccaceae bacterium]
MRRGKGIAAAASWCGHAELGHAELDEARKLDARKLDDGDPTELVQPTVWPST